MRVEIQAQATINPSINITLLNLTKIDNYDMLDMFGMIEKYDNGTCRLARNIVVLRDDEDSMYVSKPKTFPLNELFSEEVFTPEELRQHLEFRKEDFRHLRLFLSYYRYHKNEKGKLVLTQRKEDWYKYKAWRYDIDDPNYTLEQVLELVNKVPLKFNMVKKSNKGWHLFYVFDRFIERSEVEQYNPHTGQYYLPYKVHEILTQLLPFYLKELEPKLDHKASMVITSVATRFIRDNLPAYVLNPEYSLETFVNAYSFLEKKTFAYEDIDPKKVFKEILKAENKAVFTNVSRQEFYSGIARCGVIKILDENWENHSYHDWFFMACVYAGKIYYAETEEEREKLEQEFIEKSSVHPTFKGYDATKDFLDRIVKVYMAEGVKIHGCRAINGSISPEYLVACKSCRYKKVNKEGQIYGHYIFSYLSSETLEDDDIVIPGWDLRDEGWCSYNHETGEYERVLPWFKIEAHYIIKTSKDKDEYVEIVDKTGKRYMEKVERRGDSYKPNISLVMEFGAINTDRVKDGGRFLAKYIEEVKEKRGIKVEFIGYKHHYNGWEIVVGGYGRYTTKELSYIFHNKNIAKDWYIPEIKGNEEIFKATFKELLNLDDAPLHLAIAHFLSWIGKEFIKDDGLIPKINPILAFVGDTGTGKSLRVRLATALYGKPNLFSFTATTQAGLSNRFPLLKAPFGIDEVITKSKNDERKFGELIYNITNIQGKMTFEDTYDPIEVPVAITGETENLLIDRIFTEYPGLNRRCIVVEMSDSWKDNADTLDEALPKLQSHHGHILNYVKSLKEEDKTEIVKVIETIQKDLNFGDASFKDLRKHLALSLAMFYHFFNHYIGMPTKVIEDKINAVAMFVADQINTKQVVRIGENVDFMEEVINFIARVKEAMNNKKSLQNLSYEGLFGKIGSQPSKRVGNLLKKFFWKKYTEKGRKGSCKYRFIPGVLITNPFLSVDKDETAFILQTDKERLSELTNEELKIWADVLKLQYTNETLKKIVDALDDKRLKEMLKIDSIKIEDEPEVEF